MSTKINLRERERTAQELQRTLTGLNQRHFHASFLDDSEGDSDEGDDL